MAEEQMIKHTKAAIDVARDGSKTWKHKLQDILLEIGIIVFAVSLSIWLHNWAESRKDREEERDFYVGLKKDIQADLDEMKQDRAAYEQNLQGIRYFESVGRGQPYFKDSLKKYLEVIFGTTQISPRISRFEALKGSGRLDIIRNKDLLISITDLYQKDFPHIVLINNINNEFRSSTMFAFVSSHLQLDSAGGGTNWQELFRMSQMRIIVFTGEGFSNSIAAYTAGIDKCERIIGKIDKELE